MIDHYRNAFNQSFSAEKYLKFLAAVEKGLTKVPFRLAETPVFIPAELKEQLIAAGQEITDAIKNPDFKTLSANSIPAEWNVPGENDHPHFLTFDFGVCKDEQGNLTPKLIEMQGFPSLYGFQPHLANHYKTSFDLSDHLTPYFEGINDASYISLLKEVIVGEHQPHEVALMDTDAMHQKRQLIF